MHVYQTRHSTESQHSSIKNTSCLHIMLRDRTVWQTMNTMEHWSSIIIAELDWWTHSRINEYGHRRVGAVIVMYSKLQNEVALRCKWPKENSYKIAWKTLQYGMFKWNCIHCTSHWTLSEARAVICRPPFTHWIQMLVAKLELKWCIFTDRVTHKLPNTPTR